MVFSINCTAGIPYAMFKWLAGLATDDYAYLLITQESGVTVS